MMDGFTVALEPADRSCRFTSQRLGWYNWITLPQVLEEIEIRKGPAAVGSVENITPTVFNRSNAEMECHPLRILLAEFAA